MGMLRSEQRAAPSKDIMNNITKRRPLRSKTDEPMYGEVRQTEQITPSLIRVVLGGGTLDRFVAPAATDAYINARFLPRESMLTVPFAPADVERVGTEHRPKPRRFTIRRWDASRQELTIDFVVHGDTGYAGSWAARTQPGDRLQFTGPGGSYRASETVAWHLLIGDESALGAIGATLEDLPTNRKAEVFIVVDGPEHEVALPTHAEVSVTWLHRSTAADAESTLADAVAAARFPDGDFDVPVQIHPRQF